MCRRSCLRKMKPRRRNNAGCTSAGRPGWRAAYGCGFGVMRNFEPGRSADRTPCRRGSPVPGAVGSQGTVGGAEPASAPPRTGRVGGSRVGACLAPSPLLALLVLVLPLLHGGHRVLDVLVRLQVRV